MSTINLRHEAFIQHMISHGDRRLAYQQAYPGTTVKAAYAAACRLMCRPEIRERIRALALQAQEAATTELKQQYKQKILEDYDKRVALAKIVMCKIKTKKVYQFRGHKKTIWLDPTPAQILAAIYLDAKLEAQMEQDIFKRMA